MVQDLAPPRPEPPPRPSPAAEQRFLVHGVSWKDYVVLRETLDIPGLRMTYCEGVLELMTPLPEHEDKKTTIARLVELYAIERDVRLYGYGNATFRKAAKERGAEPDECWTVDHQLVDFPDIALEVVLTSGGIDKLRVYEAFGVREVWFFEAGRFHLHALGQDGYEEIARSVLLPGIDFSELARLVELGDQDRAVRAWRDALRG